MLILGIETSCDETAASLLEVRHRRLRVLSNIISSQVKLHAKYGGVVPSLAAREHVKNLPKVLKLALQACKIASLQAIDLIAVTCGPGLISSLLVGTAFAKTLAWKFRKPIVGVNHLEGHIASNWLAPVGKIFNFQPSIKAKLDAGLASHRNKVSGAEFLISKKIFPAMCLIVSGGHTQLVLMSDFGKYKLVGETLDDAAGEAFDKIARILGLGYPGGPAIAAEANKVNDIDLLFIKRLPRPMFNSKKPDFSFSGLKTAVLYLVRDFIKSPSSNGHLCKDLCNDAHCKLKDLCSAIAAEAQQAIVDVLISKTIHAAEKYKAKSIMLSGGVSANALLRSNLERAAQSRGIKFFKPDMEYTTDNAAMIALAGYWNFIKNKKTELSWQNVSVDANLTIPG